MQKQFATYLFASATILMCLFAASVQATPITWAFTGTVDTANNAPAGVQVGMAISGEFTFESTAADITLDPNLGQYAALTSAMIRVPAASFEDSWPPFEGGVIPNLIVVFPVSGNVQILAIHADGSSLGLAINLPEALPSDALPQTPPAPFDPSSSINWSTPPTSTFSGTLDSLTLVPEPSLALLLGAAAFAAASKRRRATH